MATTTAAASEFNRKSSDPDVAYSTSTLRKSIYLGVHKDSGSFSCDTNHSSRESMLLTTTQQNQRSPSPRPTSGVGTLIGSDVGGCDDIATSGLSHSASSAAASPRSTPSPNPFHTRHQRKDSCSSTSNRHRRKFTGGSHAAARNGPYFDAGFVDDNDNSDNSGSQGSFRKYSYPDIAIPDRPRSFSLVVPPPSHYFSKRMKKRYSDGSGESIQSLKAEPTNENVIDIERSHSSQLSTINEKRRRYSKTSFRKLFLRRSQKSRSLIEWPTYRLPDYCYTINANGCLPSSTAAASKSFKFNNLASLPDAKRRLSDSLMTSLGSVVKPIGAGFCRNRLSSRRLAAKRLVQKSGDCNVKNINVPAQRRKFLRDIFTTLIDVKWRYLFLIFSVNFFISWTLFATIYYLICYFHGDFEYLRKLEQGFNVSTWKPCVKELRSFPTAFLFSMESQHTIGYGFRHITEACPLAMMTLCLQCLIGVMIQAFMAGLVFAKLSRPKKRAQTLIFSKNAVIAMRDGKLCFLFRVGDMRRSHIVEAHIRLQMIKKRVTNEGEFLPFHQFDMDVGFDAGLDRIFLVWPLTICHVIDETSPLYEYGADDLQNARFEIIAILEGIVESTAMTMQSRTSYLPSEILWGHRFEKLVTYQRENGEYRIDYQRFHNIYTVETPQFSAKQLDEMMASGVDPFHTIIGNNRYQHRDQLVIDGESESPTPTPEKESSCRFGESVSFNNSDGNRTTLENSGKIEERLFPVDSYNENLMCIDDVITEEDERDNKVGPLRNERAKSMVLRDGRELIVERIVRSSSVSNNQPPSMHPLNLPEIVIRSPSENSITPKHSCCSTQPSIRKITSKSILREADIF